MNVENVIEICVALGIAILGIAYPIIVDKISNIGDKYQSQYIPVLFNNEFPQGSSKYVFKNKVSIFKLWLILTLISFLPMIFQAEPPWGWDNWFINNSSKLLVFAFSFILVILFFMWINKVSLYNGKSSSLLKHIIKKYDSLKEDDEMRIYHLKAINELTYYAVEKQDEHLQETLLWFYQETFANIRRKHKKDSPLIYPEDLYFMVNRLNEEATVVQNIKLKYIEDYAVSGYWLLGRNSEEVIISEKTYDWLWKNICTICDYPRLVKMFWAHSSQYHYSELEPIRKDYDDAGGVRNTNEIEPRNKERDRFLEFHYALGGLTYYRKKYDLLKYFFEYPEPSPNYTLLPNSMTEIFSWFWRFRNIFAPTYREYYFPELVNSGNREQVRDWICNYISILFIRQYSLTKVYSFQDFTGSPNFPDISESDNWLRSIPYFERCLNDVIANEELLIALGYKELVEQKKEKFKEFIEKLKKELEEHIANEIREQELRAKLSEDKIKAFYESSNRILTDAFKVYAPIFNPLEKEHSERSLKILVNSDAPTPWPRSVFTEGDTHFNGGIIAKYIAVNIIRRDIPNSFTDATTKRYLLKEEDLVDSLSKLIGEDSDIVIVGVNIQNPIRGIIENIRFKGQIEYIPSTWHELQDLLFILRKKDLPAIEYRDLSEEERKELKLEQINDELKIYASVIDINKEIKDKWKLPDSPDLEVLLALSFRSVIHWKDSREVIQINITSEFKEQGIPDTLNDIKPLGENKDEKES
jgi:hypothetical protein